MALATFDEEPQEQKMMTLFPFQMEIFNHPARFKVIAAGRRTGKSHVCCVMAIDQATRMENARILMIGPTYGQAREAFWTTLKSLVHPGWLDGLPREADLELRFVNGSRITLKGSDRPDTLRGISPSPTRIIMDEFAFWKAKVWEEVVMPMTADPIRKADVIIISTPKGIGNDFHKMYEQGQDPNQPDWMSWQFAAVDVRPDMRDEIVMARNTLDPRTFDQEYAASFLNTGHMVFEQFRRDIHVREDLDPVDKHEPVHICIDFNVTIMAASVFCHRGDQLHFVDEFHGSANTDALVEEIKSRYPGRKIFAYPDASGRARKSSAATGVTDFSILRQAGFAIRSRNKQPPIIDSVNAVNRALMDANGNTRVFFSKKGCPGTIRSMEATQWKEVSNSQDMDNASIDKSMGVEHYSDGVRYAIEYLYPIGAGGRKMIKGHNF